jgi:hypothetical protein
MQASFFFCVPAVAAFLLFTVGVLADDRQNLSERRRLIGREFFWKIKQVDLPPVRLVNGKLLPQLESFILVRLVSFHAAPPLDLRAISGPCNISFLVLNRNWGGLFLLALRASDISRDQNFECRI